MAPTSDGAEETASFDGGDILESASILSGVIGQKDEGGNQAPPKRKRQKLTHLTEEEKMMRRKLKNRMAAQSARDRKKSQMGDLEKLVLRLEKQNTALMKENQSLRVTISTKSSTSSSTKCSKKPLTTTTSKPASSSLLTRELLDRVSSSSSSESAVFGSVLPQKERTAAWVRRQLFLRLSTATRCFTCLIALMMTSSLRSRMLSSENLEKESRSKSPLSPQEKRLLLRLHMTNQSLLSCCHQRRQGEEEATSWWGPQQQSWNPARITAAKA